eukprot:gene1623-2148_t
MPVHAQQFAGDPKGDAKAVEAYDTSRRNFLALIFCLMIGTAALPHILMRYYTVPSVREARESVTWSLFFIFMLYFTAPALAVLVKYEVFNVLVGTPFDKLPAWIASWQRVDPGLLNVVDLNKDGLLQLGEITIGGDIVVLATPEIGGLPYVVSGLVAAGGLAAALSTADGLLLTIANALSHDLYYKMIDPNASTSRRVAISKSLLLVVALYHFADALQTLCVFVLRCYRVTLAPLERPCVSPAGMRKARSLENPTTSASTGALLPLPMRHCEPTGTFRPTASSTRPARRVSVPRTSSGVSTVAFTRTSSMKWPQRLSLPKV